jgi:O-antigen ligase
MPVSETPYASVLALFAAIPTIAVLVAAGRLSASPRAIAVGIVAGMVAGIFVGALQVAGGPDAWAYFYPIHNAGAVGFFANHNHMATLLLVGIPMTAALMVSAKSKRRSSPFTRYGLGAAVFILTLVGIVLTGSRAALALSLPVILASATMFPLASRWRGLALAVSAIALLGAVALVVSDPIAASADEVGNSRPEIWKTATTAIADSFPVGTGLGSFEQVYHRYEDAGSVSRQYVNHAHNDYLEAALELGAAGVIMIVAFLLWWAVTAVRIWASPVSTPFARAATIATAAVLVHSAVDFPLRTAAISAIFGACVAFMTQHSKSAATKKDGEARPTRHVALG